MVFLRSLPSPYSSARVARLGSGAGLTQAAPTALVPCQVNNFGSPTDLTEVSAGHSEIWLNARACCPPREIRACRGPDERIASHWYKGILSGFSRTNQRKTDPRGRANGPLMNPSLDGGNLPRLFRHFRTGGTLHTEPFLRVRPPVHWNIGSKNGYHPTPALQAGCQGWC